MPIKLQFAIKYYDQEGRLKPSVWLVFSCLYLARGWLLLAFSYSGTETPYVVLNRLYPASQSLLLALIIALPSVFSLIAISYHRWIYQHWSGFPWLWIKWLMVLVALVECVIHVLNARAQYWLFHYLTSVQLLASVLILLWLLRSQYVTAMLKDWSSSTLRD